MKHADQIAVMMAGKIAEKGTYDQLMAIPNGQFRRLVERQTISSDEQLVEEKRRSEEVVEEEKDSEEAVAKSWTQSTSNSAVPPG